MLSQLGLGAAEFAAAFPFHFIVDAQLTVLQVGPSLSRLLPAFAPGVRADEYLRLFRPEGPLTFQRLQRSSRDLLVLSAPSIKATLRGSMMHVAEPVEHIVFLGSPWITDIDDLRRLRLAVHDFALHDATPDLLHYHQAQQVTLGELREATLALKSKTDDLRTREGRTRAIINSMVDGIVVLNNDGVVIECNDASLQLFGVHECRHDVPFSSLLAADSAAEFASAPIETWAGKTVEWQAQRPHGLFPIEVRFFEVPDITGVRLAAHLRDLTGTREMARLKQEFIATVSHELRTPLTSVMGSLKLLSQLTSATNDSDVNSLVAMAERNAARLRDLVNEILDLERMDTGRMEVRLVPTPVSGILQASADTVSPMARQELVTLAFPASEDTLSYDVRGDAERLAQVLINLVSNAVKFSPRGSTVEVSVHRIGEMIECAVSDRGPGIPEEFREIIFERFRQVESNDTRKKGGSGLGLAIAQSIVAQHGGAIGFRPREGGGSTFWFTVPSA